MQKRVLFKIDYSAKFPRGGGGAGGGGERGAAGSRVISSLQSICSEEIK